MLTEWSFPTRIVFGEGAIQRLPEKLAAMGCRRPLVVTDRGVAATGLVDRLAAVLQAAEVGYAIFDGVQPNPVLDDIVGGAKAFRGSGCDGIVALGGGSPMDAGKLVRLKVSHDKPLEDYDDNNDGGRFITPRMPPMIAIPTTAGTGSEVGRSGVVTLASTGRKTVIFSPFLIPTFAIIDPELTVGLPPHVTAATGVDALTHGIESYCALGYHPMADGIALECVRIAAACLPRAVANGQDIEARRGMMAAAMMGAVAFQKGLGACHSLAHPLSSEANLHHGLANALMLPHVLRWNEDVAGARLAAIALAMGAAPGTPDLVGEAARRVESLCTETGLPRRLRDTGIAESLLARLADKAFEDGCHRSNPKPVTKADLAKLYEAAF